MTRPDDLAARGMALNVLEQVFDRRQPLDIAFAALNGFDELEPRDRGFTRMLATTAIRHCGRIDAMIRKANDQGIDPSPATLHHILRIGAAQILFMDVPDYAAVDSTIRLAARHGLSRQGGFVNAVLRRIAREHEAWSAAQDNTALDIPAWLMETWQQDYGDEAASAIAASSLTEAPLDITLRDPSSADHWASVLEGIRMPTGTIRRASGGSVTDLPGFAEGAWWVQDAAAALPAKLFGDVAGKTVIDLCAAPGGKTAQLASMGAHVIALDRSKKRLERLHENMARLHLADKVEVITADAATWMPARPADFILLDAPCTATGTIRRNPDVLHLKSPEDMAKLIALQSRLLDHAATMLKPGGTLIYCTCSLQKDEGERQVEAFLKREASMARRPVSKGEIGILDHAMTELGDIRLVPFHLGQEGGIDGFYIARMHKAASA